VAFLIDWNGARSSTGFKCTRRYSRSQIVEPLERLVIGRAPSGHKSDGRRGYYVRKDYQSGRDGTTRVTYRSR
jgi:hypothetical protein